MAVTDGRDLFKKKKEDEKSENSKARTTVTDGRDLFMTEEWYNEVKDKIVGRVENWITNSNDYLNSASNRYKNYNTSTFRKEESQNWLSTITEQKNWFTEEAKNIDKLLADYGRYLGEDFVTSAKNAISDMSKKQDEVLSYANQDIEYWSQFDSADAYSKYLEDVKKYEAQEAEKAEMISTNLDEYNYYTNSIKLKAEYAQELENRLVEIESDLVHFPNDATLLKEKADIEKKLVGHSAQKYWSQVEERNAWSKRASYLQTGAKMAEEALKASDFGQYSKYASTKATGIWDNLTSLYGMGYKDLTYEYINGDESLRSEIIENSDKFSSDNPFSDGESSFEEKGYEYLDEKEKQIYNYYYAKEGKKKAEQYLDTLAEDLQERKAVKQFEKLEGRTGMEILFGIEAGIDQFTSGIKNLLADGDRYIPATSTQMTSGMVREDLADNGFKVLGSSLGQIGYDAITNTANMLPSMLTSTVVGVINPTLGAVTGNLLLGASSAGNAYAEMINLGYSKGQARAYSALVGGSEAGLQYLLGGIGKLGGTSKFIENAVSKIDNTFGRVALGLLGNMASEGFEEGLQTVLEPWFKSVVSNVDFEAPDAEEVLYSSLLGALSAGVLEGGGAVAGGISTTATGKEIKSTDGALDRLTKLGSTMSLDSVAYKLAGKVNEKTGAYTIGRLFNEIGASMSEANKTDVANALMAKGMTDSDAWTISEWLASAVDGHTFNKKQIAALESNDVVSEVFRDVIIDQNSTVNQRMQGYSDILKIADEVANGATEESSEETTEPLKTTSVPRSFAPYSTEELTKREAAFRAMGIPEAEAKKMAQAQPNTFSEGESSLGNKTVSHREFSSSSEGKTILTKTGEEVQIKEVASTKDGQMTLKLTNGETVNAKDVSYSSSAEALVYEAVADMGVNPATATALIKGYDGQIPAKAYVLGIKEAYTYGKYNFPVSEMSEKAFSATLSETQRSTAYKLGQIDEKARITTAQEKLESTIRENQTVHSKGGKLHYDEVSKMGRSKLQKTSLKALERVANALGIDIHLYESSVNEKGVRGYTTKDGKFTTANGWYDPKDGSIHIDINAGASGKGTMLFTAAHELTHFIKRWSPEKFKVLADFLMEKYGEKGVRVSELVQRQINKAKKNGRIISYDVAYEEVIADSMETMLSDGDVVSKLEEIKAKDRGLWEKIKEFITDLCEKIKAMYADLNPDSVEGQYVKEMVDSMEQLKNLFTEALVDASDSYSSWIGTRETSEFSEAKTTDGEALFQYRAMEEDKVTYRAMLKKHGLMTDTEIDDLFNMIDDAVDVIKNNLEVLDYAWDVDINDRAFMPVKPNSDSLYKVSLDFSTLCRKRLLQQTIQNMLQETLNKQLSKEEAISIRNELMKIQEEGRQIEIACALCYVESARMKSPAQIKKFLKNKETILIDFFAGKSGGSIKDKIKQAEADTRARLHAEHPEGIKGKDGTMLDPRTASLKAMPKKYADEIREAKRKAKASYQPTAHEAAEIEAAKTMKASDFTSPEGLENLAKNHPELFDAYTSFVRNATKSKGIEKDTWWRAGDSDTLIGQSLIDKMNAENGLRSQSWSDFQVIHLLDYIAATIELSTKNAKRQSYTKVPDYVRLLGNTGDMINMSLIPTRAYNGKLEYDPVEGMAYEVALELRKKYHATAGTICIGIHNDQIKALLADLDIDYVIPYHKSGMSAATRKLMHIPDWKDYEPYQIESMLDDADAKKNAEKYGVKLLDKSDEMYHAHTNFSEWFDLEEARQIAKMENANPSDMKAYKKYGDMYGAYKAMQNAANNYLKLCAERGIAPKFSHPEADFTQEENYWKLLIDRKMVDNVTGEIIEQKAIKPIFKRDDVLGILNDELARYPEIKKDQDYATRKVVQKFLSGQMKVDKETLEAIKKPIDNVTKVNIMESSELLLSDRDSNASETVIEIAIDSELVERIENSNRSKYSVIRDYLVEKFYGQSFTLSDGIEAIMDKRDAQELSHQADSRKEAALSNLRDIIEKASFSHKADGVKHNKFDAFRYYSVKVSFDGEIYDILLNVGHSKYKDEYHIYDITKNKRTANQSSTGLSQPVGNAMKSGSYDNIISQTDDFVNTQDENILLSDRVTDKETIEFLENQEHIVTYKAMQVIDGKLYPPMAAKVKDENGRYKLSNPSQLGVWQQATEDTKNIKKIKNGVGYYSLNKGVGSPVEAAYNPYEHSSNLVLNDQFESAYLRDNLVVVECVIPSSEMSSGYKAQYAKDTTGVMDWKAGVVAGKIKNNKRKVYLSRYLKPVRILSDAEVASKYKEVLEGTGVSVPFNVVHPSLLAELEKVGVDIDYEGSPMYQSIQKRKAEKDDISYSERVSNKELSEMDDTALYIKNTDKANYIGMIFNGTKTEETRSRRTLDAFIGKDFYVTDGKYVYGSVVLGEPHKYTEAEFHKKENQRKHRVPIGDEYDIKQGGIKWAYPIESYNKFDKPKKLSESNEYKNSFQAREVLYQEREADTSNRAILANAFESVAQNDIEKQKIAEYKEKISLIEEEQRQLAETRAKIKEISFSKGKRDEKLLKSLKFDAVQAANRINTYDKQLLRLEASKPLADVLSREKYKVKRRMEQKSREALAEQRKVDRERMEKKLAEVSARNQESRHRAVENRNRTELRHKIKNVVSELNKLLLNGSKEHNVKINLQKATAEALMAVNMDTVNAEERLANIQSQIDKEMSKETPDMAKVKKLKESYDNVEAMGEKMTARLTALKDAYEQIKDSDDPLIAKSHDETIALRISNLRDKVGDTPLRSMTLEQLEFVYDTYKMVLTTIRDANKAFNENIKMTRLQLGSNTFAEIKDNNKARETIKHENLEKFMWQNLKPMTAMKTIGSKTLQMLYNELLYGQEVFAKDYDEAVKFAEESKKKHGYDKWDMSKTYSFQSKSGKVMKLNLEQMMSVYAYSKRKQADAHIEKGGIVLNESVYKVKDKLGRVKEIKVNDSNAYRLSKDQVAHIVDTLEKVAPNSKAFVDEMQKYLSDTMGAKGNEVSLKMYGIKLFKETHYFPLKSSKEFMEAANTKLKGDVKIKNKGMTKETVPDAKNPIVLEGFLDVWGNHVNEMSLYHGLVLPLEDFERTLNYSFRSDEKANVDGESINKVLHDAFGESATDYLHNLTKHINGGVLRDSTTTFADKAISKFKKGAVMASLSVVVQQPTAIVRAMAHINPKYFVHSPNLHHFETWEELKKYCPTAIIKETGSFDTNMGRSIVEMVKDEKTAMTRIDDFLSWLPAHADVMGWNMIWKALKNKIATEQKLSGEALLKAAGKQMTLIINETQVYDSVMARSELMRSKDGLSKMATSFMAEPTAVANMVYGAGLDLKRGQIGKASATVAAVMSSIVLNSIVSSLVYALRDDDEDRTYWEKYLESLTTEVVDGFNPLTYIPYIKDVYSVFQGYDVKRTDMSIFADLNDSLTKFYKLFEFEEYEDKSEEEIADYVYDNLTPVIGSICNMFGLPLENVLRDTKAVFYNSWHSLPASQGTGAETWYAFRQGILNAKPKLYSKIFGTVTKSDKVYEAILSGDEKQIARIKSQYKTEEAFESAIRNALRENDPRIKEAAIARFGGDIETYKRLVTEIVKEGHFKQDFVVGAVNTAMNKLDKDKEETEEEYEKQTSIFSSEDLNASLERGDIESAKEIIADLVKVKTENNFAKAKAEAEKNGKKFNEKQALKEAESKANSSVKSSMTSHWKPLYKKAYRENNTDEMKRIRELLYASGIYGRASEVVETVKKWLKED